MKLAVAEADFSGSHVLIVEDNSLSRELLCEMVADLGCTVDSAADGVEAVEKTREIVYDLILMDVQMPRLDGLGATRRFERFRSTGTRRFSRSPPTPSSKIGKCASIPA